MQKDISKVLREILFIVPTRDIRAVEQLRFIRKPQGEARGIGEPERRYDTMLFEGKLLGWLESECSAYSMSGTRNGAADKLRASAVPLVVGQRRPGKGVQCGD